MSVEVGSDGSELEPNLELRPHSRLLAAHRSPAHEYIAATTCQSYSTWTNTGGLTFFLRHDAQACWTCFLLTGRPPRLVSTSTNLTLREFMAMIAY